MTAEFSEPQPPLDRSSRGLEQQISTDPGSPFRLRRMVSTYTQLPRAEEISSSHNRPTSETVASGRVGVQPATVWQPDTAVRRHRRERRRPAGHLGSQGGLLLTDGEDTQHAISWWEVLDKARADGVMIYTIGLESDYFNGLRQVRSRPDGRLRTFAEETGGGYFEPEGHRRPGARRSRGSRKSFTASVSSASPRASKTASSTRLEVRVREPGDGKRAQDLHPANRPVAAP